MSLSRLLFLSAAIMASAAAGCTAPSDAVPPNPVTLSSGIPGGVYHPVGNAICRMFNLDAEHEAMPCIAMSSDGSISNIRRVESGDSAFGLSQTDVALAAFNGEGPFDAAGPDPKLRTVIALYPEAFTVVARADTGIRDFQDLRGKRVGIGTSGVGYNFTRDVILKFYGGTTSPPEHLLEFAPAEQNQALCNNKVDAIIFEAGHPNGLTQEATTDAEQGWCGSPASRSIDYSQRIPITSHLSSRAGCTLEIPATSRRSERGPCSSHRAISPMKWSMPWSRRWPTTLASSGSCTPRWRP